jgi:hypothetical protein
MCVCICMCVCFQVCLCVCVYICVYVCTYLCVCVYVFIQDPDPGSDPELSEKSDLDPGSDPKKIIPDPQHCFVDALGSKVQHLRECYWIHIIYR